ncbi:MAG: ABC transporter permease [Bacteroidia bacterium]|nr:ABC transporter permease [Bacteroidia bacterium]
MFQKIYLVTKREYVSRVKKKSFLWITFLTPLLISLFYGAIFYFTLNKDIGAEKKEIFVSVNDTQYHYTDKLKSSDKFQFVHGRVDAGDEINFVNSEPYTGLLVIPSKDDTTQKATYYSKDQADLGTILYIENQLTEDHRKSLLQSYGVPQQAVDKINTDKVKINTIRVTDKGQEKSSAELTTTIGFIGAFMIYLFIFMFGVQIMRGVIEEKSNRIVEVIVSSVRPFELMIGKIIGIALVGLTQFFIWTVLLAFFGSNISGFLLSIFNDNSTQEIIQQGTKTAATNGELSGFMQALSEFNFYYFISMFVFYFIGGYLFYGSLFAAIGSAVDNETDTQQFMLPITMPLIFALVLAQSAIINNPNGAMAVWLSVIPFFSPVVMMLRLPFDPPQWQVILSVVSLIIGFIFSTWFASRIYRIGILMHGTKPSYKLLIKWLFSKD